jgi:hypothetical protein
MRDDALFVLNPPVTHSILVLEEAAVSPISNDHRPECHSEVNAKSQILNSLN